MDGGYRHRHAPAVRPGRATPVRPRCRQCHPARCLAGGTRSNPPGIPNGASGQDVDHARQPRPVGAVTLVADVEDLTPEWLSEALRVRVSAVRCDRIGTGQTAATYRLT